MSDQPKGRLVWVPSDDGEPYFNNPKLRAQRDGSLIMGPMIWRPKPPAAAGIDALMTPKLIVETGTTVATTLAIFPASTMADRYALLIRGTIKAALRELLGVQG